MQPSNLLKINTLNSDWRDKDNILLHACFQLLTDFVEKELTEASWIDWQQDTQHQLAKAEIDDLYAWWQGYQEAGVPDKASYEVENQMLKRLIDIRWALWV